MNNWKAWKSEKDYRKLFWSGMINGIGNRFTQVALLTLLYQVTGSSIAIGYLFVIRMVPFILLAPLSGVISNKLSNKKLLMYIDMVRVPFALIPLFVQGTEQLWLIYVSAGCISLGEAIYAPTRMAFIPSLVKQDRLIYVNAIEQIMLGVVLIIGSSTGGIISFVFGLSTAFVFDAISFILSAMILNQISFSNQLLSKVKTVKQMNISIYKVILSSSALLVLVFIEFTMPLANGIDNVLMSIYALDVFKMGDIGVGLIYGCLGLGFMLSSFFPELLKKRIVLVMVICIGLEGLGHIVLGHAPTFLIALATVVWITFVGGISTIFMNTITMKTVPTSRQGAFFGVITMVSNTSMALSMGVAGWLVELFAPRPLSIYVGWTYICFTILYAILFTRVKLGREKRYLNKNYG